MRLARALRQHVEGLRMLGLQEVPKRQDPVRSGSGPLGAPARGARTPSARVGDGAASSEAPAQGLADAAGSRAERLAELARQVQQCRRCPLYRTRTHAVVGDGPPAARLVLVGEAPGREEDLQGKPFVGAAGHLLTRMLAAISLRREEVYICNVLKDRPPGNRTPLPEEIAACRPFLEAQLEIIRPAVILALGAIAANALLGTQQAITKLRGTLHAYRGMPMVPTFHPAYLLRNPAAKRLAWADLKTVRQLLGAR
jgi:DNA polymerase